MCLAAEDVTVQCYKSSLLTFKSIPQKNCLSPSMVCCSVLQCVKVCCSVLQCVAVRCSALQCVAVRCSALQCVSLPFYSVLQCVAAYCSVLQCIAMCCSVLQCVAACFSLFYVCSLFSLFLPSLSLPSYASSSADCLRSLDSKKFSETLF